MLSAYFNCSSGIAGDMILAACIDAGIRPAEFRRIVKRNIGLDGWDLQIDETDRYHFPCKTVRVTGDLHFKSPDHMKRIIRKSGFSHVVKEQGIAMLGVLASAEAKVHRVPLNRVHFHELNSIDTLVDILGSVAALELLKVGEVRASAVNTGKAAPAALAIAADKGIPVYADVYDRELMTPTGAAVISVISSGFGCMPCMNIKASGFGAGTTDIPHKKNVLTAILGETSGNAMRRDEVAVLDTNIDDMDPRIYPYLFEKLFMAGAKDVWLSQVLMKKGRPGIVLSVIASPEDEEKIAALLFKESTTLGIRARITSRYVLERESTADRKTAFLPEGGSRTKSEYEIVKARARKSAIPLKKILI